MENKTRKSCFSKKLNLLDVYDIRIYNFQERNNIDIYRHIKANKLKHI